MRTKSLSLRSLKKKNARYARYGARARARGVDEVSVEGGYSERSARESALISTCACFILGRFPFSRVLTPVSQCVSHENRTNHEFRTKTNTFLFFSRSSPHVVVVITY